MRKQPWGDGMPSYLISYDLRKQRNYQPLWTALEEAGAVRLLESLWLANLNAGVGAVRQSLSNLMDNDDGVAVIELQPGSEWATMGALPAGTNWLANHIRRY